MVPEKVKIALPGVSENSSRIAAILKRSHLDGGTVKLPRTLPKK
jgi:hypothetical protein